MNIQKVKISEIRENPDNPRIIKDENFKKLVKSIQEFPEMLELRPIIVDDNMVVLGGNMRLKALQHLKYTEVPIIKASDLTDAQKKEFIIKDNVGYGEWDWDILANKWDNELLSDWGLDVDFSDIPTGKSNEKLPYSMKIEAPIYEPQNPKPKLSELVNTEKYFEFLKKIDGSNIPENEKEFLKFSAMRMIEFDYSKIADYYAHSNPEMQDIMESLALVIIDFDKAIEDGYVKLSNYILDNYVTDYDEACE